MLDQFAQHSTQHGRSRDRGYDFPSFRFLEILPETSPVQSGTETGPRETARPELRIFPVCCRLAFLSRSIAHKFYSSPIERGLLERCILGIARKIDTDVWEISWVKGSRKHRRSLEIRGFFL